ncbi:MAG: UDP-N-acetylglucosamine 2-epimerase (non-hydrolyzing) [Acidobacteriaceae bacterium]|nr:UDP-N-acetylglucosamine 2-epimerase (non-hydrolyzing) [Acidobacteriaceae bacterium]
MSDTRETSGRAIDTPVEHSSQPVTLAVVAGARPNFMKVAPLMRAFVTDPGLRPVLIHTGQHYDENMSGRFFRELGIPHPDYHLGVGGGTHAEQTAEIMRRMEPVVVPEQPAALIVVGDVNSTMAGAIVASKLGTAVIHAEAGLRSFDKTMPEEINRIVTDAVSDLLLVTEESGRANLLREGKSPQQIAVVGNLMIDSLQTHLKQALLSDIADRLRIQDSRFGLVTLHRPANVDDAGHLAEIVSALTAIAEDLPLYWPMHPRTRSRIDASGIHVSDRIHIIEPLGYLDFLCLESKASLILTDSGGIQEESTVLGVPCLTLRDNTERPITIECGTNRLAGTRADTILRAWRETRTSPKRGVIPPLWDGHAGERCLTAIKHFLATRRQHSPSHRA